MKKVKLRVILACLVILIHSCTSDKKMSEDDEFGTDSTEISAESSDASEEAELAIDDAGSKDSSAEAKAESKPSGEADEFAEFEKQDTAGADSQAKASAEDSLENELNSLEESQAVQAKTEAPPADQKVAQVPVEPTAQPEQELTLEDPALQQAAPPPEIVATEPAPLAQPQDQQPAAPPPPVEIPQVAVQPPPVQEQPPVPLAPKISQINSVQYQSNQSGGAVVINSDEPLQFTTRSNPSTNQVIIEVQNSVVPKKLKRSLNTKDMASSIGSVDIYQKANSNVARFVVQLRPGSPEPLVQPEGNSLVIIGAANPTYARKEEIIQNAHNPVEQAQMQQGSAGGGAAVVAGQSDQGQATKQFPQALTSNSSEVNPDLTSEGIMNSQTLEDFLASNNKFYGKKISIEAVKLDVNDAFKFLAEESGVNMIIDEGVKGDVTLKLRQVPWDQAFVLLLKSKKLGYKRQGNVIRIAEIANLQKEEDDAIKLLEARKAVEPLTVKRFFIGYADIGELEKKIKEFISTTALTASGAIATTPSRGKVISDARTNSLIVTETAENLQKIEKLVAALDTQPKQVLIEGKVVEANEKFTRSLGVSWNSDGAAPAGNIIRPSVSFSSGLGSDIFKPAVGIGIPGSPGDLGNLNATLSLGETEDKLRVLSSPRISVLSSQSATIAQTVNVLIDKVSTTAASTGTTTVTKESVAVGVSLTVTPQVSNEGTVVMDLNIERSFLATAKGSDIERRSAKTKVIVRSGQTAVIGGIFQADATDSVSGVPFFKDIPIFGVLFKGSAKIRTKNELVIFVTPRIQKTVLGDTATVTNFQ